jgi:glycosyltransferase involved in cell wall biosynthesis
MEGEGEQKNEAVELLNASGVSKNILLLPFRQDVPDLLAAADIFVLPSLWEGLPIALLEAMAMGKAIIATKVDGTKEILTHKKNGYLIDLENLQTNLEQALLELSRNKDLRSSMEKSAKETVKDSFNAVKMTEQIQKIYQDVIAN